MKKRIVSDSSANMYTLEGIDFVSTDMIISTDVKEYRDNMELDVQQMVQDLAAYKGRSGTACPGVG
ncbi:MAG: fatty acid-binding protein DegV, partial [Lachnospiraceae bacterium]|nr:fatty acid-binding protein DegV [Lachnospiraceae bacterium]